VSTAQQPDDPESAETPPAPATRVDIGPLYVQHHGRLRRHALSCLSDDLHHEADKALMIVFTRLLDSKKKGQLTEQNNWEAYLVRAVTNACLDILKTTKDDQEIDQDDPRVHRDALPDPTGDTAADRIDRAAKARLAKPILDALEPRLRTIVLGKLIDKRTNRELGAELGLTGQRIGQLYDQTMQQLQEEVNRHHG